MSAGRIELHPHLEDTVRAIAELHADHEREASAYERAIGVLTEQLTRPLATFAMGLCIVAWIGANAGMPHFGLRAFDPFPFSLLQGLVTFAALLMTILILTSQRYDSRLAERRARLTLQFAMVGEQKIAKVIELLERRRRDDPRGAGRDDEEALAMAEPADGQRVAEAVDERHKELLAENPVP